MSAPDPRWLFVGSYTNRSTTGIRTFSLTDSGSSLTPHSGVNDVEHASFLAAHPNGRILYAVSESSPRGELVAMRFDPHDGSLEEIDRVPSHGADPCHINIDARGRYAYVANYGSGTVAAFSLESDGRFGELIVRSQHEGSGPHPRQDGPHANCVVPDPTGDGFYAVDLGIDAIRRYSHRNGSVGADSDLADSTAMPPGSGPRHLTFHPQHLSAFVVGELDSTLICLDVDRSTGELRHGAICPTLPDDFNGESIAADVHVHPNGRFVYVSNRGHDSIAAFALDKNGANPTLIGHTQTGGRTPRNFAIHPSGDSMLVANQDSNTIVSLALDPTTGLLSGATVVAEVDEPVCLLFSVSSD